MTSNLAIIPARSGSKGLPGKNIKPLLGKPLIAYSIEAAIESQCFDTVHLSTDSEHYAEIGRKFGADVPFLRSEYTSSDKASTWDAVIEVIENYRVIGKEFDTVTVLQPTSPLREAKDIQEGYDIYYVNSAKSVIGVCECNHSPLLCNTLPLDRCMNGFISQSTSYRRQDMSPYYRINGALYIVDIKTLLKNRTILYNQNCFAYIMPNNRSVDIDSQYDFYVAESIMKYSNL